MPDVWADPVREQVLEVWPWILVKRCKINARLMHAAYVLHASGQSSEEHRRLDLDTKLLWKTSCRRWNDLLIYRVILDLMGSLLYYTANHEAMCVSCSFRLCQLVKCSYDSGSSKRQSLGIEFGKAVAVESADATIGIRVTIVSFYSLLHHHTI